MLFLGQYFIHAKNDTIKMHSLRKCVNINGKWVKKKMSENGAQTISLMCYYVFRSVNMWQDNVFKFDSCPEVMPPESGSAAL